MSRPGFKTLVAQDGHMVIPAAVLLLAIAAITGGIYDWRNLHTQRAQLKAAANAAALEGASALAHAHNTDDRLAFSARALVASRTGDTDIETRIDADREAQRIDVALSAPARVRFPGPLSLIGSVDVSASAERVTSGGTICALALPDEDTGAAGSISVGVRARLTAEGCVLHADGLDKNAVKVSPHAAVSVGGFHQAAGDRETATDGEAVEVRLTETHSDPLAGRPASAASGDACDFTGHVVTGHESLSDGVYCGGLTVDGGTAELYAGAYILRDGPLRVMNGGRLRGEFVGFELVGETAVIDWQPGSDISLKAPRRGPLAGLLVRSVRAETAGSGMRIHRVASADAHRLTGTVYLPGDRLELSGTAPIAAQSDFTILVAGELSVASGANLILNTGYEGSDVPVPTGLGPTETAITTLANRPAS